MSVKAIKAILQKLEDREKADILQRFFKTGPGEYGEGDIFLGIRVPELRKLSKTHQYISIYDALELLQSAIHEERLLALLILIHKYRKGDPSVQKEIYDLYLKNTRLINNWDLVDLSAEHIVGHFLMNKSKNPLYALARSDNLWDRRISVLSTFYFIKQRQFSHTLKIAKMLISDQEDLIHKAVGWMLREIGKRDLDKEESFLKNHYKKMPRTMLRYAIEKFPEAKRQQYLKGEI